jgi:Domain of unknown function (DUF1707).
MLSTNYRLTSQDRTRAMKVLQEHLRSGSIPVSEFKRRIELVKRAMRLSDLEVLFADLGGVPSESTEWRRELKVKGQQLRQLDIITMSTFIAVFLLLDIVLNVSWAWIALPGILLIPLVPRSLIGFSRRAEIIFQENCSPPAGV